jgi:hypothetical protein
MSQPSPGLRVAIEGLRPSREPSGAILKKGPARSGASTEGAGDGLAPPAPRTVSDLETGPCAAHHVSPST